MFGAGEYQPPKEKTPSAAQHQQALQRAATGGKSLGGGVAQQQGKQVFPGKQVPQYDPQQFQKQQQQQHAPKEIFGGNAMEHAQLLMQFSEQQRLAREMEQKRAEYKELMLASGQAIMGQLQFQMAPAMQQQQPQMPQPQRTQVHPGYVMQQPQEAQRLQELEYQNHLLKQQLAMQQQMQFQGQTYQQ